MIVSTSARTSEEALKGSMIGLSAGIPLQTYIDEHLRRDGITPDYRVRLTTLSAVYVVASTGVGSAILPLGTVRRLVVRTKPVLPIEEPRAQRDAWMLVKEGRTLAAVEKFFYRRPVELSGRGILSRTLKAGTNTSGTNWTGRALINH